MPFYDSGPGYAGTQRLMMFIDGGYLRPGLKDILGTDWIEYNGLVKLLTGMFLHTALYSELIRTYYYDAILSASEVKEEKDRLTLENQQKYIQIIKDKTNYCEVRLGTLKKDGRGDYRQKGVDTLIAIDMLSKAYENHYDIAILVSGDEDILEIVKAVKNTGKRVYGVFFERHISEELRHSFDRSYQIDPQTIRQNVSHFPAT